MDNTVRIWTLLSKMERDTLLKEECLELEAYRKDLLNKEAFLTYERLSSFWKSKALEEGVDTASYWEAHKKRMAEKGAGLYEDVNMPAVGVRVKKWYQLGSVWKVAALLVLAIGATFYFKLGRVSDDLVVIVAHNGDQKQFDLPDGSQVWLNSGSELSYAKHFASAEIKEISLKGEAFFDIKHLPNRTFIIHTGLLDIKDVGTRFNVKAYEGEQSIETTLINGAVEVYPKNHPEQSILLRPNEKLVISAEALRQGELKVSQSGKTAKPLDFDGLAGKVGNVLTGAPGYYVAKVNPQENAPGDSLVLETAWMNHQLAFSAVAFRELARNMERWYDIKIEFRDAVVADYIFSGVFREETFEEALEELKMIQPFHYKVEGRKVVID